jgi:hypothetical protein
MPKKYDWLTVSILIGLPGSGKTTYINQFAPQYNAIFDDILAVEDVIRFKNTCKEFGGLIVIADCNLCNENNLYILEHILNNEIGREVKIEKIYFENNPDACRANVAMRNDGRNVEGSITNLSMIYSPPKDAIRIWSATLRRNKHDI